MFTNVKGYETCRSLGNFLAASGKLCEAAFGVDFTHDP